MLVARRDPFHPGAHETSLSQASGAVARAGGAVPRLARAVSALQIVGALLAIPVGIGSAYSMYRANFSIEATCQGLRGNIVAMLDKNVDAGTRHVLARRDVEAFQQSCGAVDPDATAAFKALLAADKAPLATVSVPPAEPQPQAAMRKAEPAAAVKAKPPAARVAAASAAPIRHDAAVSDAAWVAAVRNALVSHKRATPAAAPAAAAPTSPAAPPRMLGELRMPVPAPLTAPALPPPAAIATIAAPQADSDRPVPPAAIPQAAPQDAAKTHSRLGDLVAQIPFVGKTIADRVAR